MEKSVFEMREMLENTWAGIVERGKLKEGELSGVPTGFHALDELELGWQPEELYVLGARPGVGKTALLIYFARAAARNGKRVYMVSLEMSHKEVGGRVLVGETGLSPRVLRTGRLTEEERKHAGLVMDRIRNFPLVVDDSTGACVDDICSRIKSYHETHKVDIVMVDYAQLMCVKYYKGVRAQELGECTRQLKILARELGCPVILLSQLNRTFDNDPTVSAMSALKDSGCIEQDADMLMVLKRCSHISLKDGVPPMNKEGISCLEVLKNRHGEAPKKFYLRHNPSITDIDVCPSNLLNYKKKAE